MTFSEKVTILARTYSKSWFLAFRRDFCVIFVVFANRNMPLVPSETHIFFSRPKRSEWLLLHVCSENGIFIGNVDWSPAKRWYVFRLPHSVSNFCHTSAAKVSSCLHTFIGLQRNDEFSFMTNGWANGGQLLLYVCRNNDENTWRY